MGRITVIRSLEASPWTLITNFPCSAVEASAQDQSSAGIVAQPGSGVHLRLGLSLDVVTDPRSSTIPRPSRSPSPLLAEFRLKQAWTRPGQAGLEVRVWKIPVSARRLAAPASAHLPTGDLVTDG